MAIINLKCPNCGGSIQMDDARETGFCMYCGEKFLTKEEVQHVLVQHSGNVELSRKNDIDNLLIRLEEKANLLISNNQISVADYLDQFRVLETNYIDKILDLDAKNQEVIKIRNRIKGEADKRDKEKSDWSKKVIGEVNGKIILQAIVIIVVVLLLLFIVPALYLYFFGNK